MSRRGRLVGGRWRGGLRMLYWPFLVVIKRTNAPACNDHPRARMLRRYVLPESCRVRRCLPSRDELDVERVLTSSLGDAYELETWVVASCVINLHTATEDLC
ncbi:hypothetical protein F4604DRAFT_1748481 [Suillus subluteus]|nr:hypothetical protein F4604DRAFT_1748481 [Suillus subluteus]